MIDIPIPLGPLGAVRAASWWVRVGVFAIALLAAVAAVLWGVRAYNESLREDGRNQVRAQWEADKVKQRDDALRDAEANAKETQRRLERQGDAQREQALELARYQRVAADAVAARDGLQLDVDNLTAVARRAAVDAATAGEREAGIAAAGMLADVSRGADKLAEVYAREADTTRRAGVLCERDYDALRSTSSSGSGP